MEKGTDCRITGLEARRVKINVSPLGHQLEVVFALVDTQTKQVVSWKKKRGEWPAGTDKAIEAFLQAIEHLAASDVFGSHAPDKGPLTIAAGLKSDY